MKYYRLILWAFIFANALTLVSCRNDNDEAAPEPFKWSNYYLAGKIIPVKTPDNYTPYMINLDDEGKGQMMTVSKIYKGTYKIQDDKLIFNTDERDKWFTFTVKDNKITDAAYEVRFKYKDDGTYEPAPVKYTATGFQDRFPSKNSYVGSQYIGDIYKTFTTGPFSKDYVINFNDGMNSYTSGAESQIHFTDYKNVAFRADKSTGKEFGVLIDGKMVVGATDSKGFTYGGTLTKK